MPFAAFKFRDVVCQQDCGYLGAFQVVSAASSYFTGGAAVSTWQTLGSTNNFHKLAYRLVVPVWGQSVASNWSHGSTNLYLYSLASSLNSIISLSNGSSVVSIASNWGIIDSVNFTASFGSAASSVSGSTYVAMIDMRPEKFSTQWPYVTPVVVTTIGNAMSTYAAVVCDAYVTDYEPASLFDSATLVTAETDYF